MTNINDVNINDVKKDSEVNKDEIGEISPEMHAFFQRADSMINLANSQLGENAHSGQVGASLMYASARYSASVSAIGFANGNDFAKEKQEIIEFYSKQFRQMLADNLDDYAQNFDKYVQLNQ